MLEEFGLPEILAVTVDQQRAPCLCVHRARLQERVTVRQPKLCAVLFFLKHGAKTWTRLRHGEIVSSLIPVLVFGLPQRCWISTALSMLAKPRTV